jgi:hypothetical protein
MLLLLALLMIPGLLAFGQDPPKVQDYPFEGSWSAAGTRQALAMGPDRKAVILYLSGSLLLTVQENLSRGFRCEAMGFDDGENLSVGECLWTDDQGDQIFCKLKGQAIATGRHITGTITGGTGRYAGITGEFEFDWQYVVQGPDGTIQGRTVGLKGKVRPGLPAAKGAP